MHSGGTLCRQVLKAGRRPWRYGQRFSSKLLGANARQPAPDAIAAGLPGLPQDDVEDQADYVLVS